jgi:hypothetical protein
MTIKDGGPAFPESYIGADSPNEGIGNGMTLRDYFAAKAMQGMASSPEHCSDGWAYSDMAIQAYELADAMIKAREAK